MDLPNLIVGGASYGFRVAYRVTFYSEFELKGIVNFDGSVYDNAEDEFRTILEINNYELNNFNPFDLDRRQENLAKFKSSPFKSRFVNDFYIGPLNGHNIYNFYPKYSAVGNFSKEDLTDGKSFNVALEGNHENMLLSRNNFKIIKRVLKKIVYNES